MDNQPVPVVPVTPKFELLYTSRIEIASPQEFGPTPYGERKIINITGGAFEGPRIAGRVLPGGADWQVIRNDNTAVVEARYTLETDDAELIYVNNWGYRHGPVDVIRKLGAGAPVDPKNYYFRTTPRFETGAETYDWLNRSIFVATGARRADCVIITVYEVT